MMPDRFPDRRDFLASSMHAFGGMWLTLVLPDIEAAGVFARMAVERQEPFTTFTPAEARAFEAAAVAIIPDDDLPGAREAGVVYFADRVLGSFLSPLLEGIRAGLRDLDTRAAAAGARTFAAMSADGRAAVLRTVEDTPFFGDLRFLVITGMFSDPSHGGNRNGAGWRLLRMEHAAAYSPPFGYYDGEARRGGGGVP